MRRTLVALWLVLGVGYAISTCAAELYWKQGYATVELAAAQARNNPDATAIVITGLAKGLEDAEIAARLAPEIHWLRSTPAQVATENMMLDDAHAIDLLRSEIGYDPYNPTWLAFLFLRLKHADRMDEAREVYQRVREIWPGSPLDHYMMRELGPFK